MAFNDGNYIVFGNFNVVRRKDERWGCVSSSSEADDSNSLILHTCLKEVVMGGILYTRVSKDGKK